MMKKICFVALIVFGFVFPLPVSAVSPEEYALEQAESMDINSVVKSLPEETREIFKDIGVEKIDFHALLSVTPKALFDAVKKVVSGVWKKPVRIFAELSSVFIFMSLLKSMSSADRWSVFPGTEIFCTAAFMAILLPNIAEVISHVVSAVKTEDIFIKSYFPVFLAAVAASGNPALAAGVNGITIGAAEIIAQFSDAFLIPVTAVFLCLIFADSLTPRFNLGGFIKSFKKAAAISLGFCAAIFSGILTTGSVLSNAADSVAMKGAKLALSSFVPIVGGALGDGLSSIFGGLALLKSAFGIFGILAAFFIIFPTLVEIVAWNICFYLCAAVGDLFEQNKNAFLLRGIAGTLSFLNVILLFQGMILIVSAGVTLTLHAGI